MADKLKKGSVVNGANAVATFEREGLNIANAPIDELLQINLGSGLSHNVDMKSIGYPIQLLTLFANDDNASNEYLVTVNNGTNDLYKFTLTQADMPFSFPANIIQKTWGITVNCTNAVDGLAFIARQCWLLDEFNF